MREFSYMPHAAIRMIATDIDGTLLDSEHRLPDRNRRALAAAHEAGIHIVLVTGRRFPFALPIAELLPFDPVLITCNGAVIRSRKGVTHMRTLLPRTTAAEVIEWTRQWRAYAMLAYDNDIVETATVSQMVMETLQKRSPQFMQWYQRVQHHVRLAPLEAALSSASDAPLQVMFSGPIAPLVEIKAALDAAPFRARFHMTKTLYTNRDLGIMDLIHPDCSKGAALAAWAKMCGIAQSEVMAVGDNHNDLDMLNYAGLPVVMGNAVPELRAAGWQVTGDNDSDGLAQAVEKILAER